MSRIIFVVSFFLLAFCLCFGQDSLNMRRIGTWIAPDTVGFYGWPSNSFTVIGNKAFLGSGAGGGTIWQIDISDPTSPELDTVFASTGGSLGSWGYYLYACGGRRLRIFDTRQTPPLLVGDTTGSYAYNAADADSGYVVSFRAWSPLGITRFDVSDPENPFVIYEGGGSYEGQISDIYVRYPYAYSVSYFDLYGDPDYDVLAGPCVSELAEPGGWCYEHYFAPGDPGQYPWSIVANESLIFVGANGATHVYSYDTLSGVELLCSWDTLYGGWDNIRNNLLAGSMMGRAKIANICEPCEPELVAWYQGDSSVPSAGYAKFIDDSTIIYGGRRGIVIFRLDTSIVGMQCRLDSQPEQWFELFPNPLFRGQSARVIANKNININLYDIAGRLKMRISNTDTINAKDISPGLYLAVAHFGKHVIVKKLLVLG